MRSASRINAIRRRDAVARYVAVSVTAAELVEQAPDAAARLDSLPSRVVDGAVRYPNWLICDGHLRTDLDRLLTVLGRFTVDALAADRIVRLPHEALDGHTLLDALDDPALAGQGWSILESLGDS